MKHALRLLAGFALVVASIGPSVRAAEQRPNIIFLLADDLAAGAVGYSGNKDVITPNIDRLAHDGVRFTNFYDTTSICMASRCTMPTGLYEYRHGCNFDHGNLERRFIEKSYPVLLRQGLDQNTVIIFTSDNGYNAGSHGFGDKVLPYEEGSKAPLIIYDPRLPAEKNGQTCDAVTGNIDMAATIFALAGEPAPGLTKTEPTALAAGIDGKSLLPLLANPADKVRDFLPLFNFWGLASAQSMAIVTPNWKYIHWYFGEGMQPTEELFDLSSDRYEMTNSAADATHASTLATLRRHYDKQLADIERGLARKHGYENYPTVFSRSLPWEQKAELVKQLKVKHTSGDGEGETADAPKKKRKAKQ